MDFILVRGLKRSGNHLFVNWLSALYDRPYLLNDVYRETERPFGDDDAIQFLVALAGVPPGHDVAIFNIEQPHLVDQCRVEDLAARTGGQMPYLLRDPLNWMASCLRILPHSGEGDSVHDAYRAHHERLWGNWLRCYADWKADPFPIAFDRFVTDELYRRDIALRLGRWFDVERDAVALDTLWQHPAVDPPSSFDTDAVRSGLLRPSQMRVLDRYRDEHVQQLLREFPPPAEICQAALELGFSCVLT